MQSGSSTAILPRSRLLKWALLLGLMVIGARSARADGDDFFLPENSGPPILSYFGHVRDVDGNPIGGAILFFGVTHPQTYVRAKSFPDGGYQSPDLGNYIEALGSEIDYHMITVRCLKDGYVTARPPVPSVNSGRVAFDIVMERAK